MSDLTQEFVNVFCEFVEAVIHQILHLRRIYRPELFERHRLYGITTRKSRHPDLNEYIHSIATSLKVFLHGCTEFPPRILHSFNMHLIAQWHRVLCCKAYFVRSQSTFWDRMACWWRDMYYNQR